MTVPKIKPAKRSARIVPYRDRAGEWRWRLVSPNNKVIADSAESYTRKHDLTRAIDAVREYMRGLSP